MFRHLRAYTIRNHGLRNRFVSGRQYTTRSLPINRQFIKVGGMGLAASLVLPSIYSHINNDTAVDADDNDTSTDSDVPSKEDTSEGTAAPREGPQEPKGEEEDREPTAEDYDGAAYNPITGEINWDCPCLGGMAHGPCGEEFKEAFACFVYSETEPKGIDCIKKFEAMRGCFRRYPEVYKEQLMDEEELEAAQNEKLNEPAAESEFKSDVKSDVNSDVKSDN